MLSTLQERAERVAKKKALVDFNSEGKRKELCKCIFIPSPINFFQEIKRVSWTAWWRLWRLDQPLVETRSENVRQGKKKNEWVKRTFEIHIFCVADLPGLRGGPSLTGAAARVEWDIQTTERLCKWDWLLVLTLFVLNINIPETSCWRRTRRTSPA